MKNIKKAIVSILLFTLLTFIYKGNINTYVLITVFATPTIIELWFLYQRFMYHYALFLLFFYALTAMVIVSHRLLENRQRTLELFFIVSVSDAIQNCGGYFFGNTPIGYGPSPNKTYEGYLCGLMIGFYSTCYMKWVLSGIIGDILVSACKRSLKIKDTSQMLGAHGGWFDRVDGIASAIIIDFMYKLKTD